MNGAENGAEAVHAIEDLSSVDYSADEGYEAMTQYGLSPIVIAEFCEMMRAGFFKFEELDERSMEFAKNQKPEHAQFVLNQFRKSNLTGVQNPVQYVGSLLKNFKERVKLLGSEVALSAPVFFAPKIENLQALLDRTGYPMEVTIGQRKYGGPPPGYEGELPGNGCEIYIGRIPKDVYEDELVPVLEKYGTLYDFRLMMDPVSGTSKGYAFAMFMTKAEASAAAKNLEEFELKPGKKLRCNVSLANTRLFIGNIPKSKSKDEILKELSGTAEMEGIRDVIIYADAEDPENKKNCGYCFIEFIDHKSASTAKRRLVDGHVKPWNSNVVANWAEPQEEPDDEIMSTVRTVFIKNLREVADEETVRKAFSLFGEVYKVRRMKDYAFVYYSERDSALKAIEKMHNKDFHGSIIDVALAKPQSEARKKAVQTRMQNRGSANYGGMGMGMNMMDPYYGGGAGYYGGAGGYGGGGYDYGYGAGGIQYPMPGYMQQGRPMMRQQSPQMMGGAARGGGMNRGMGASPMRARASPVMAAQFRMRGGSGMSPMMGGARGGMMPRMGSPGMGMSNFGRGGGGMGGMKRPMNGGGFGGTPAKRMGGYW